MTNSDAVPAQVAPIPDTRLDDEAVDKFAVALKSKLAEARAKGRDGWSDKTTCSQQFLSDQLFGHIAKGDPRDVANFAMFLHQRGESILTPEALGRAEVALQHIRSYVTEAAKTPITREAILAQSITLDGLRMLALGQYDEMQGLCRLVLSETGPTGG